VTCKYPWQEALPPHFAIAPAKADTLERFRAENQLSPEEMVTTISSTPWAVRKAQEGILHQSKTLYPNLEEHGHWENVLRSRLQCTLDYGCGTLNPEKVRSLLANAEGIAASCKSFDEVVAYLVDLDRRAGLLDDPTGLIEELTTILEGDK